MNLAAIEFGGTHIRVAAGGYGGLCGTPIQLPTTTPQASLPAVIAALNRLQENEPFAAIGIASFGPLELDKTSAFYGRLLNTPKRDWAGYDLLAALRQHFQVPIALETDVNAAALAEGHEAATDKNDRCSDHVYITVGTGVGVGVVVGGRPVHGAGHPEGGHLLIRQKPDDLFPGTCFAHGACVEGLISGPALFARHGIAPSALGEDHPGWDVAGDYLAQLCAGLILILAPQRIVLGGGVGRRPALLHATRRHLWRHLGGYLSRYRDQAAIDALLVPAALSHSGLHGAFLLAREIAQRHVEA